MGRLDREELDVRRTSAGGGTLSLLQTPPKPNLQTLTSEAEQQLRFFTERMLPSFPFLALSDDVTAAKLRHERPVLFQAILTVTTFGMQQRQARAEEFKDMLIKATLVKVQSSIDLLLGLLTYLIWTTDLFLGAADLVSRLMMLATSLAQDLRLFKPAQLDVQLTMTMTQGSTYATDPSAKNETFWEHLEKYRALLTCYVLSLKLVFPH